MDLANLVRSYGYLAVFSGTFLEGETILLLAAFEMVLDDAKKYESWVFGLIAVTGRLGWGIFYLRRRKRHGSVETPGPGRRHNSK